MYPARRCSQTLNPRPITEEPCLQVDMTLFGHVHFYSRTCAVFQRNCVPARPDGSAGAPVHVLIGHAGAPFSWTVNDVTPPYYEAVAVEHGYMRATANRTAMHMQVCSAGLFPTFLPSGVRTGTT